MQLRNVETGEVTTESYDALVLSPGAMTVRPPIPGIDLPGIFEVRTVPDARTIKQWIARGTTFLTGMDSYSGWQTVRPKKHAVVVGGGFIGLETAENLAHVGIDVTVIEMVGRSGNATGSAEDVMAMVVEAATTVNETDVDDPARSVSPA